MSNEETCSPVKFSFSLPPRSCSREERLAELSQNKFAELPAAHHFSPLPSAQSELLS